MKIDIDPILYLPFLALFLRGIRLDAFNSSCITLCISSLSYVLFKLNPIGLYFFVFLISGIASLESCLGPLTILCASITWFVVSIAI
nr:hypothetical protein [Methanobrevibacter cuticularis]